VRKPRHESEHEIDYEVPEVEYEAPVRETRPRDSFDAGHCWCGKRIAGCTGNPTKVIRLDAVSTVYVCPNGRDETQITKELYEAAKKAGLVS
jgi:hypothetical protein